MARRKQGKVFIREAEDGRWYFTVNARNGLILCTSQMYPKKANCVIGAKSLCEHSFMWKK